MLGWALLPLAGLAVGHAVNRLTPFLLRRRAAEPGRRWPWVEILGALVFLLLYAELGFDLPTAKWYLLAGLLVAITSTDFRYKAIADRVTYPGTLCGLAASTLWPADITRFFDQDGLLRAMGMAPGPLGGFALSLLGAVLAFAIFEAARRLMSLAAGVEAMGMGDSKLLMMVGAFLGPKMALFSLFPGMLCGLVLGIVYTRIFRSPHFPFGPALALGGLLTLLYGEEFVAWVDAFFRLAQSIRGAGLVAMQVVLIGTVVWLMLRVRRRAQRYRKEIEEDYERMDGGGE